MQDLVFNKQAIFKFQSSVSQSFPTILIKNALMHHNKTLKCKMQSPVYIRNDRESHLRAFTLNLRSAKAIFEQQCPQRLMASSRQSRQLNNAKTEVPGQMEPILIKLKFLDVFHCVNRFQAISFWQEKLVVLYFRLFIA